MSRRVTISSKVKFKRTKPKGNRVRIARIVAGRRPETEVIYAWPGGSRGNTLWTPEPVPLEKGLGELCIGVKGQSNSVIAGSPRNSFRASLV